MRSQVQKNSNADNEKQDLTQQMHTMEAQYRFLVENTTDVIWRLNLKTMRFVYISPSVQKLRGYSQEEALAQPVEEYLTPASLAYVKQLIAERLDPATLQILDDSENVFILEQPCKDGTTVWVEATINLECLKIGSAEVVGVSRDYTKQKQQQDELAEAYGQVESHKKFLNDVMDTMPWEVICMDCQGQLTYLNQNAAKTFVVDKKQKLPAYLDILPASLRKRHQKYLEKCLEGLTVSFSVTNSIVHEMPGEIYGIYNPLYADDRKVSGIVLVVMDITSQKETERQLIEAQRIAKMGSYEWDLQTKHFSCSKGLLTLFDVSSSDVGKNAYRNLLHKVHAEDFDTVKTTFQEVIETSKSAKLEFRINKGSETRIMYSDNRLDFNKEGNAIKLVGSVIDITERKKMEDLQQEAEERLRDFTRTLPDIAFIATEEGHIVEKFGNKEFRSKKIVGNDLRKLMYKPDAIELLEKIRYALQYDKLQFGEYSLDTALGKRIFEIRIAPMRYIANGKKTVACNATDVTDKNRAQRFLETSYEQRRQREILNDLVEKRILPSRLVLDQAWRVKLNLASPCSCYLAVIKSWKGKPLENWPDYQEGYQFFIDSLTEVLTTEMNAIVWESRKGIAILCPQIAEGKDIKSQELANAQRIKELVHSYFPDAFIVIGIGEFHADTFQNIALVYSQACEAVRLGQTMISAQDIYHYLDLGMLQILPLLSDKDKVLAYIDRTIGKLLEYDRKKGSNLVITMEKILQADNLKVVADEMFVHHKTIAFRKKRIEKILNLSLDTLDNKTTLNMALKLRQLVAAD